MKPACPKCKLFCYPKKNGVVVHEKRPVQGGVCAGTAEEQNWVGYKLYHADLWECRGCGSQVITGWSECFMEHFRPDFEKYRQYTEFEINDC